MWKIKVATIIERVPLITEDMSQWERDYLNLKTLLDFHEKSYPPELVLPGNVETSITSEDSLSQMPSCLFSTRNSLETDSPSLKNLGRKLDTSIYFIIYPNKDTGWILPTVDINIKSEETLLEAAKRAVLYSLGSSVKSGYLGNCPSGVYVIPYDAERQSKEHIFGEKVFFMRVQYIGGCTEEDELKTAFDDWAWLDRSEIIDIFRVEKDEETSMFYHYLL